MPPSLHIDGDNPSDVGEVAERSVQRTAPRRKHLVIDDNDLLTVLTALKALGLRDCVKVIGTAPAADAESGEAPEHDDALARVARRDRPQQDAAA